MTTERDDDIINFEKSWRRAGLTNYIEEGKNVPPP